MSKWRIRKNQNNTTKHDQKMKDIEGEYDSINDALMQVARNYEVITLPDGSLWVYDEDCEDIADDMAGYHSLATIEKVVE